jgi:hypothetical protein
MSEVLEQGEWASFENNKAVASFQLQKGIVSEVPGKQQVDKRNLLPQSP